MSKKFNIAVCGSARVGKSTLVNALCGREVAQTNNTLGSVTDEMKKYVLDRAFQSSNEASNSCEYSISIWDTPGIESWTEDHVKKHISKIMLESTPICMIFCASPGTFVRLDQLNWIVDTCIRSNIFCALVCTNKYSGGGQKRNEVLNEFHRILDNYHRMTLEENNVKYYGTIALCTSVNSITYEDVDLGVRKGVEGINELIFGLMKSLKDDRLAAWCYTVADNQSFWLTMRDGLIEFYNISRPIVEDFMRKEGKDIAKFVIPLIISALLKKR